MNKLKKFRGHLWGTLLFILMPLLSHADLSNTLKLLEQTRALERSLGGEIVNQASFRDSINLLYQKIIELLTIELGVLQRPVTTSVEFQNIVSPLNKGEVVTITFSRIPNNSSLPIDFWIETGGLSVGSLSNQVIENLLKWQVANNFVAGRNYNIVAKDKDGKVLGTSSSFTVSAEIKRDATILPVATQLAVTPVKSVVQQPASVESGPAPDTNSGVVGWWSFDNNSNNCTAKGNALTNIEGKIGNALNLDGMTSYCVVSTSRIFYPSKFSVNLWAKSDQAHKGGWSGSGWFISLRDAAGYRIGPIANSKKVKFTLLDSTDQTNRSYNVGTIEVDDISAWHNYSLTYDGSVAKIYLDGELATSTTLSVVRGFAGNEDLMFGTDNNPEYPQYGIGALDEIRIYNRAITSCEAQILAGKVCQGFVLDSRGYQVASVFSAADNLVKKIQSILR